MKKSLGVVDYGNSCCIDIQKWIKKDCIAFRSSMGFLETIYIANLWKSVREYGYTKTKANVDGHDAPGVV